MATTSPCQADTIPAVGKWHRHTIVLTNSNYKTNPFEIEVDAEFIHQPSGTVLIQPGYYAGRNEWKIGFMPIRLGLWNYKTISEDPQLDGKTGKIECIKSDLPGILKADATNPRKWKFSDGPYVVPLAFRFDLFLEEGDIERFSEIAEFLRYDVKGHMLEFRLTNEGGNPAFPVFNGDWRDHIFNLSLWDRLEKRMNVLTHLGLGVHLMFYSDDAGEPEWSAYSDTEKLLIRYTIARLSAYPIVWFNSGIDIAEYRGRSLMDLIKRRSWVDWFGDQIHSLDPYGHPVSSRYGGGSGNMVMRQQTWDSRGDRQAFINRMQHYFVTSTVPISMDDAWMENGPPKYDFKNFRPEDIRRALWKCVIAGGLGALVRGSVIHNQDNYFRMNNFEEDLESEAWIRLINPFIQDNLGEAFGEMEPDTSLVSNGHCIANPDKTKILYYFLGINDRWDKSDDITLTINLSSLTRNYNAKWFDPRTGVFKKAGNLQGGEEHTITPPTSDDWVFLIKAQ